MFRQPIHALLVLILLWSSNPAISAVLTGTSVWSGDFAESAVSKDLKYEDGSLFSDLPVFMICVDVNKSYPGADLPDSDTTPVPVEYSANAGGSALSGGSGDAGVAAIHWLFDQYYSVYFKGASNAQKWAFQYAVWELGNDFTGNVNSISPTAGQVHPVDDGYMGANPDFISAYQAMYQALVTNIPALGTAYRSKTYTIDLFNNADPKYQSMVTLIEKAPTPPVAVAPTPVPSLGVLGLFGLTGCFSLFAATGSLRNLHSRKKA